MTSRRLPYVWDYDIDEDRFREMLAGLETEFYLTGGTAASSDWDLIRWIEAPDVERFKADLDRLGESLILG